MQGAKHVPGSGANMYGFGELAAWSLLGVLAGFIGGYASGFKEGRKDGFWRGRSAGLKVGANGRSNNG